jgi:hypothetical protein
MERTRCLPKRLKANIDLWAVPILLGLDTSVASLHFKVLYENSASRR